ncbi:Gaa1-domain-containing protein [Lactarius sanguifluus]|nr:Gaa1-domain-containing protein [Lactarius sanguifluus]
MSGRSRAVVRWSPRARLQDKFTMSKSGIPPIGLIDRIRQRIRKLRPSGDVAVRIRKRKRVAAAVGRYLDVLRLGLLATGCLWLLALPLSHLQSGTYIDENALQPSQVNTYWNWGDVHRADKFLQDVTSLLDRNLSSAERAAFFATEFAKSGIPSSTQRYSIPTARGVLNGTNAYAVFSAPRTSGTEAVVISASWKSLTGGYNLRGVSTVLSLATFMTHYSHWSKDIIFVISDSHLDGMHAWLSAYHTPTNPNQDVEPLSIASGVIWTALKHRLPRSFVRSDYFIALFVELQPQVEGLNGRLPNQDLINSFRVISQHTSGVPVLLYDHYEPSEFPGREQIRSFFPSWLPDWIREHGDVHRQRAEQVGHTGFSTNAITLFAVPSNGPHGFHALGRTVESTLRTMNNLLERLHASFFFYIMTTPSSFLKIGSYLPSVVLVAASLMFGGLGEWVKAGWVEVKDEQRPSEKEKLDGGTSWTAFMVVVASHLAGLSIFVVICGEWLDTTRLAYIITPMCWVTLVLSRFTLRPPPASANAAPLPVLLKAINMCLASTLISVTSVLNFSLAALLAITLGVPLSFSTPSRSLPVCVTKCAVYATLAFGWLAAIWDWQVLGVWFAPLVCLIYVPFVLQAGIVSGLAP